MDDNNGASSNHNQFLLPNIGIIFHREGVNLRHMGLVRKCLHSTRMKNYLLIESVARIIKFHYRKLQRKAMIRAGKPSNEPIRAVTLDLFNLILLNNESSLNYWNQFLKPEIQSRFESSFDDVELSNEYNLKAQINLVLLFERIGELCSVKISSIAFKTLRKDPSIFEFVDPDIIDLGAKITHLNLIDYADGMSLYYEAQNRENNPSTQKRLLQLSSLKLESSLLSMSTNYLAVFQLGNVMKAMASKLTGNDRIRCLEKSISAYSTVAKQRANCTLHCHSFIMYVYFITSFSSVILI